MGQGLQSKLCIILKDLISAIKYTWKFGLLLLIIAIFLVVIQVSVCLCPALDNVFYLYPQNPSISSFYLASFVHDPLNIVGHLGGNIIGLFLYFIFLLFAGFLSRDKDKWADSLKISYYSIITYLICVSLPIIYIIYIIKGPLQVLLLKSIENTPLCGFSVVVCAFLGLILYLCFRTCSEKLSDNKNKFIKYIVPTLLPLITGFFLLFMENPIAHCGGYILGCVIAFSYEALFNSKKFGKRLIAYFIIFILLALWIMWLINLIQEISGFILL